MPKAKSGSVLLTGGGVIALVVLMFLAAWLLHVSSTRRPINVEVGNTITIDSEFTVPRFELLDFADGHVKISKFDSSCKLLKRYRVMVQSSSSEFLTGVVTPRSQYYYEVGGCPVNAVVQVPKTLKVIVGGL
jgi:hypothetical protein